MKAARTPARDAHIAEQKAARSDDMKEVNIRLDAETIAKLDEIAKATKLKRDQVIAVILYLCKPQEPESQQYAP